MIQEIPHSGNINLTLMFQYANQKQNIPKPPGHTNDNL